MEILQPVSTEARRATERGAPPSSPRGSSSRPLALGALPAPMRASPARASATRRGARSRRRLNARMRHTISVLVENEFGVLARVAGLFSGRGFNIESLCGRRDPRPDGVAHHAGHERRRPRARADHQAAQQARHRHPGHRLQGHASTSSASSCSIKVTADERTRGEVMSIVEHLPRQGHRRRPAARTSSR